MSTDALDKPTSVGARKSDLAILLAIAAAIALLHLLTNNRYPTPVPTTFIVIDLTPRVANLIFTGCRVAAHNGNSEGAQNEESQFHPDIIVCGPTRLPLPELWKNHQEFQ